MRRGSFCVEPVLALSVFLAIGCSSKTANVAPMMDDPILGANQATYQSNAPSAFAKPISSLIRLKNGELPNLAAQLEAGEKSTRIAVCERLGVMSQSSDGYASIDLLSRTMREDPSMEVRIAATNALAGIADRSASGSVEELVSDGKQGFEKTSRLGLIRDIWR